MLSLRVPISHSYGTTRAPPSSVQLPPKRSPTQMMLSASSFCAFSSALISAMSFSLSFETIHQVDQRDAAAGPSRAEGGVRKTMEAETALRVRIDVTPEMSCNML